MEDLEPDQIKQQDFVDNEIFDLICRLNPTNEPIEWNIQMISDVRLALEDWLIHKLNLTTEMEFYPFLDGKD